MSSQEKINERLGEGHQWLDFEDEIIDGLHIGYAAVYVKYQWKAEMYFDPTNPEFPDEVLSQTPLEVTFDDTVTLVKNGKDVVIKPLSDDEELARKTILEWSKTPKGQARLNKAIQEGYERRAIERYE
jgi:Ser-tRNA(Ala) deacylase AlaX